MDHKVQIDEIDLRDIIRELWYGKFLILFCMCLGLVLISLKLHQTAREFTVSVVLQSAEEQQSSGSASQLSGLPLLVRGRLPSKGISNQKLFQLMITSTEVSNRLLERKLLVQKIFSSEWDSILQDYHEPKVSNSVRNRLKRTAKYILTGDGQTPYVPPNGPRLAEYISKNLVTSIDQSTGLLHLHIESGDPKFSEELLLALVEETDILLLDRFMDDTHKSLEVVQEKLKTIVSPSQRKMLAELIEQKERDLLLNSEAKTFLVKILRGPDTSVMPTSPKVRAMFFKTIVWSFLLGCFLTLMRKQLKPSFAF